LERAAVFPGSSSTTSLCIRIVGISPKPPHSAFLPLWALFFPFSFNLFRPPPPPKIPAPVLPCNTPEIPLSAPLSRYVFVPLCLASFLLLLLGGENLRQIFVCGRLVFSSHITGLANCLPIFCHLPLTPRRPLNSGRCSSHPVCKGPWFEKGRCLG